MRRSLPRAVVGAALLLVPALAAAQSADAPAVRVPATLRVPGGAAMPVLVDGRFAAGEWDDARRVAVGPSDTLLLKEHRGHVYVGVIAARPFPVYVELFLRDGSGTLHHLHASMQLGERTLVDTAWTDASPRTLWGNESDWTANESKFRPDRRRPNPAVVDTGDVFPQRGREFQLRRSRFVGTRWQVRLEVRDFGGRVPDLVVPAGSHRKSFDGWLTLELP
jgi:hypothetical protein